MNKLLKSLLYSALCTFAALSFTACNEDDSETPTPNPPSNSGISVEAYYKGDIYDAGTGNLWINFQHGLTYDASIDDYKGPGYILCLDFNTALATNPDFAQLATGVYKGSQDDESHAEFTLNLADGDSYLIIYDKDGNSSELEFTSGTVNVSKDNLYYYIEASLVTSDDKDYKFQYAGLGTLPVINISDEGEQSNITADVTLSSELTQGCFTIWGEVFETEASNYATIILAGKDYDLNINYGTSPSVTIGLNVTPGAESLPEGTYEMLNFNTAEDFDPFTAFPGMYESSIGGYLGCWYYNTLNGVQGALRQGTVTITKTSAKTYTITFDLLDGYDHHVRGTYSGELRQQIPVD